MSNSVCGTSRIVGFRFSLYPMSDQFVEIIQSTLKEVDKTKVWVQTDDISTCIRGKMGHVFDVAKAMYIHAAKTGKHVVLNGTFSIGCPGDSEGDTYMSEDDVRINEPRVANLQIEAPTQFALYPMNKDSYMQIIAGVCEIAKEKGTFTGGVHYASRLDGDAHDVFETLEEAFRVSQEQVSHVTMTVNISANSPSRKKN
ncbi:YkoF family thiamine/hydroxymethylpyrimidine-binding protein [Bacillus sp. T33-2]|uniref:YkoF family thiamine/hydroxymethylpyrimidine-binding protein n=1 Tax=Bacillus sp. T33-2 TaxID=2054168 RepID=UPI000C779D0C|nr:YkoF family thiamine/hydroxymethylpyrimidine-binding protein [Bacillus sp. T33-2]PLR95771.1 thiamine-binding protein [Bacillus sp. T33-2]